MAVLSREVSRDQGGIRLFDKWSYDDVEIKDISLTDYLQIRHPVYLPHTAGRFAVKRFRKAQCPIVERLTNSLMMHGRNNGKKLMAVRIVKHAFEIIHLLTDQNPIQVLIDAIINTGPREDSTRIGSAGTVRRQAVDVSPLRRVNQAIHLLTTGARESAFRNIKSIAECLADELINAAKGSSNSYAIKKKDELERVAKSKYIWYYSQLSEYTYTNHTLSQATVKLPFFFSGILSMTVYYQTVVAIKLNVTGRK
jgi:small subunit ribosomal protein S5e